MGQRKNDIRGYQDNALAEVIDGGGTEDVSSGFESPIVVIGRHALESEVSYAIGMKNGGEAGFNIGGSVVVVGRGDGDGVGEALGQISELEVCDSLEDSGLSSL